MFEEGQTVEITCGTLKGLRGKVKKMNRHEDQIYYLVSVGGTNYEFHEDEICEPHTSFIDRSR